MDAAFVRRCRDVSATLRARHGRIVVMLAPPRTCSTALVRVFWRHPDVGSYNNEPFDRFYHRHAPLETVLEHLEHSAVAVPDEPRGDTLVIKEMTFQAAQHAALLAHLSTGPLVFVLRDPRLGIASRMRMVAAGGGDPLYPHVESGWDALYQQVTACRSQGRRYVLVDAHDFRSAPEAVLGRLFATLGMTFGASQLRWTPAPDTRMGNLAGAQDDWYIRVLGSRGLERPAEAVPGLDTFPVRGGFRAHVERALDLYGQLRRDPALIAAHAAADVPPPTRGEFAEARS